QVAEHVTLSNRDIIDQLSKAGTSCDRDPAAGNEGLKSIFLNFNKKLNSPEFILPTRQFYSRQAIIKDLGASINKLLGPRSSTTPLRSFIIEFSVMLRDSKQCILSYTTRKDTFTRCRRSNTLSSRQ